jgi:drug/metabolite transporter (DMT)-like permease
MTNSIRGAIYGLTAAAIWGGMYVVSDVVLQTIPPFTLLTIRLTMALIAVGFFVWRMPNIQHPTRAEIYRLMAVGFVGFGVSVGAQFVGTDRSTAVNGALITSGSPAFILLFAALILREKLTLIRIAAVVLASIGVVVIIDPANANFGSDTFYGDMALAVAAVTWGLFSVLVKLMSRSFDTLLVTWYGFLGGLILTIPASVIELQTRSIGQIGVPILLGILYLGVISTAAAMWLWNRAFALVDASVASLFFFAQPLVATLLSALLLNQQMNSNLWLGSAFIVLGVMLSLLRVTANVESRGRIGGTPFSKTFSRED